MTRTHQVGGPHRTDGERRGFQPQGFPLWAVYPGGETYLVIGWVLLEAGGLPLYSVNAAPLAVPLGRPGSDAIAIDPGCAFATTDPTERPEPDDSLRQRMVNLADELERAYPTYAPPIMRRIREELDK